MSIAIGYIFFNLFDLEVLMRRATALIIFIVLAFSGSALALGNPDFSGTWTLDIAKSDMGQARPGALSGAKVTIVIKQTPAVLAITRNVGKGPETATLKLDGTESINKLPSGKEKKSTSAWVGSTLVTKSTTDMGNMKVSSTEVFSLSPDGKVMTIDTTLNTPSGVSKKKLIYNKQ